MIHSGVRVRARRLSDRLRCMAMAMGMSAIALVQANDISITNLTFGALDTASSSVQVRFDINWENSWRLSTGPKNWDAAWVFVKFRTVGGAWQHARLHGDGSHNAGSGTPAKISTAPQPSQATGGDASSVS